MFSFSSTAVSLFLQDDDWAWLPSTSYDPSSKRFLSRIDEGLSSKESFNEKSLKIVGNRDNKKTFQCLIVECNFMQINQTSWFIQIILTASCFLPVADLICIF